MFKRILILAILLCLAAMPAPAQSIYGDGWYETDYRGLNVQIPQDWHITIKLPIGWSMTDYSGSVALFQPASGGMSMSIHWINEQFHTYTERLDEEYADKYTQCGRMILDQDRDWWLGVTDDTFTAETTGRAEDFELARQMISSVYNAEEGDFDGCAED